jgi:hypothetical protein
MTGMAYIADPAPVAAADDERSAAVRREMRGIRDGRVVVAV